MYGVVEILGHQYQVKAGDVIDVQKLPEDVGSKVELDRVLFIGGKEPRVGLPVVEGAKVKAEVLRQGRSRKITVLKRKPGTYQRKNGHRQSYTSLKILEIADGAGNTAKI